MFQVFNVFISPILVLDPPSGHVAVYFFVYFADLPPVPELPKHPLVLPCIHVAFLPVLPSSPPDHLWPDISTCDNSEVGSVMPFTV